MRNYAAARLSDGSVVTGRGRGSRMHAEIDVLQQVDAMVQRPRILELYTERQPCCACEAALGESGVAPESVSFSAEFFDMPDEPTVEDAAELARLNNGAFEALRQMIREAEGPLPKQVSTGRVAATERTIARLLGEHGLRAVDEPDLGSESGVEVVADELGDEGRGVYLSWYAGSNLTDRVLQAVHVDQLDDPALSEAAAAKQHRLSELAAMLDKAGIQANPAEDGIAPYTLMIAVEP